MQTSKRFSILILVLIFGLTGCFSSFSINSSDVIEIRVSEFDTFRSVNEEDYISFDEKDDISVFVKAIKSSNKQPGAVDMTEGDFSITLIFSEKESESFHLWLSKEYETGSIMSIEETHTLYTLSESSTSKIQKLLFD